MIQYLTNDSGSHDEKIFRTFLFSYSASSREIRDIVDMLKPYTSGKYSNQDSDQCLSDVIQQKSDVRQIVKTTVRNEHTLVDFVHYTHITSEGNV